MKTVLVTGAKGFIGRNLAQHLRRREDVRLLEYDLGNTEAELRGWAAAADVVFHLAGVNRPESVEEFESGNTGFTKTLCHQLRQSGKNPRVIVSSSIQAESENPYGASKRHAEQVLDEFAITTGVPVAIFRLKNVFGKWCRPNYNSVVATFCHNIAHDLPIQISDPAGSLELVYVGDVVTAFLEEMDTPQERESTFVLPDRIPSYALTLDDLADRIHALHEMQQSLLSPDFSLRFNQQLYATYLSYVDPACWEYRLKIKNDAQGSLAEFIKSPWFGQIFVSRTRPGITRGNHYHHTKAEKFLVLTGKGLIRLRHIDSSRVHECHVQGEEYRVVEIPPGYTHSITNIGSEEMITLFWASEIFEPDQPDTYFLPVDSCQTEPELVGRASQRTEDSQERATR